MAETADQGDYMMPEQKLAGAGLTLPPPHPVVGTFALVAQRGEVLYVSGHGAFADGEPVHRGKLGADLTTAEGKEAARAVMLALLGTVRDYTGGLDRVNRLPRHTSVPLVVGVIWWSRDSAGVARESIANGASLAVPDKGAPRGICYCCNTPGSFPDKAEGPLPFLLGENGPSHMAVTVELYPYGHPCH
jgi:hypothetical protein